MLDYPAIIKHNIKVGAILGFGFVVALLVGFDVGAVVAGVSVLPSSTDGGWFFVPKLPCDDGVATKTDVGAVAPDICSHSDTASDLLS